MDMSHSAAAFARTYGGMALTKTDQFKASLNSTITRALDDKLPIVISQACGNFEVLSTRPVLQWAYMAFFVFHMITTVIIYFKTYRPWWTAHSATHEADHACKFADGIIQDSVARGLTLGYDVAAIVNLLLQISYYSSSIIHGYDGFELLSTEGLLFTLLPAIGALGSVAWPSSSELHVDQDEEMGVTEKHRVTLEDK
ncbi:MAG: hypothetical protein Q9166_000416 [cf. Caloplaca sp. 2 TL-2023]